MYGLEFWWEGALREQIDKFVEKILLCCGHGRCLQSPAVDETMSVPVVDYEPSAKVYVAEPEVCDVEIDGQILEFMHSFSICMPDADCWRVIKRNTVDGVFVLNEQRSGPQSRDTYGMVHLQKFR